MTLISAGMFSAADGNSQDVEMGLLTDCPQYGKVTLEANLPIILERYSAKKLWNRISLC